VLALLPERTAARLHGGFFLPGARRWLEPGTIFSKRMSIRRGLVRRPD
jgi:hypothetical protein